MWGAHFLKGGIPRSYPAWDFSLAVEQLLSSCKKPSQPANVFFSAQKHLLAVTNIWAGILRY
jgi:hypothetical protein